MLTRSDIVASLRDLGLQSGDRVLVHSSLPAFGPVEGGADAVIEALIEAVGPDGLVAVPTFVTPQPFDRRTSPTSLGVIADRFWRREGSFRSLHPTHSLAAIGRGAEELLSGHELAPTAYAEGTPYHCLATQGGKVLLMGVDQDRNTTLHTAEALSGAPYLDDVVATYVADDGGQVTIPVAAMAGPHRNFIGLDPLFRERGVMRMGKIGNAVCRLMGGGQMLDAALEALRKDPTAVLCDNPACADCVGQRARIKAAALGSEDFKLAAVAGEVSDNPEELVRILRAEAVTAVELTREEYDSLGDAMASEGIAVAAIRAGSDLASDAELAARLGVTLVAAVSSETDFAAAFHGANGCALQVENVGVRSDALAGMYERLPEPPALAFNPAEFARMGEKPFLSVYYRGLLRRSTQRLYVADALFTGEPALPGRGNAEVKEILSALRCRSFGGYVTLRCAEKGAEGFRDTAAAFWKLLESM